MVTDFHVKKKQADGLGLICVFFMFYLFVGNTFAGKPQNFCSLKLYNHAVKVHATFFVGISSK